MINLSVTLTGIEASTPIASIADLLEEHPLLELGVLYRANRQGQGRYPSTRWIETLLAATSRSQQERLALHVCGAATSQLLAMSGEVAQTEAGRLMRHFGRVQLNFDHSKHPLAADAIRVLCAGAPQVRFITQHNASNQGLAAELRSVENHEILFDASLGAGQQMTSPVIIPIDGKRCGYAGGLSAANLPEILPEIMSAVDGREFWIDMESSVRTPDDCFSLDRARAVLDCVQSIAVERAPKRRARCGCCRA